MRVLIAAGPGVGHVFPMVPLAWALRAAGHEVLLATAGPGLVAGQAGLPVIDLKPGWDYRTAIARRWQAAPTASGQPGRRPPDAAGVGGGIRLLAGAALTLAASWHPDVVVGRTLALLVAAKQRAAFVDHGVGLMRTPTTEDLADRLQPVLAEYDIGQLPTRQLRLEVAPPSMLDGALSGQLMRYVPYNGGGTVTPELVADASGDRPPRVAVTLGTAVPLSHGLAPATRLIPIMAAMPAEFVLALGDVDGANLPDVPDNVRLLNWTPLNLLLRSCSALIHHGGEGTAMTALALGVPQLVIAEGVRSIVAHAVQARGVGHAFAPDDLSPTLIGQALADGHLADNARQVAAEIAALPPPAAQVGAIEALLT